MLTCEFILPAVGDNIHLLFHSACATNCHKQNKVPKIRTNIRN